jgi:hypothetical protein
MAQTLRYSRRLTKKLDTIINSSLEEGLKMPPPSKSIVEIIKTAKDELNGRTNHEVSKGLGVSYFSFASCTIY